MLFCTVSDYLVIGSDSGKIVILEYIPAKNTFEKVHQETFGKSGCRRIVPGQYLAIDPKGRAVMIGEYCQGPIQFHIYVENKNIKRDFYQCFITQRRLVQVV